MSTAKQMAAFEGTGEMADKVGTFDWSVTPLGTMKAWPERLKLMVEQVLACPVVSAIVCGPHRILIYNDVAASLYGDRHPQALGKPLPETFPEGWAAVAPLYERAFAGESLHVPSQRLDVSGGGSVSTVEAVLTPIRESDGTVAYVHMTGQDVTGRVSAEAELSNQLKTMEMLVTEFQHRARNSYTLIQSIANETLRDTGSPGEFMASFSSRLSSLARVQDLLALRDGESVTLRDLVDLELEAIGTAVAKAHVEIDGPDVPLRAGAVQSLALVVHELATNARKYGALAGDNGRLQVRWTHRSYDAEPRLRIEWLETLDVTSTAACDGPAANGGYGRKLIERALPFMLSAETTYEVGPAGVRCTIEFACET